MPHYTEGAYDNVEIVAQGFTKSSQKGTPGFFLKIQPGEYDRTITFWLPNGNEKSVDIMLASLESLGLDVSGMERFTQLDPRSASHVSFVGQFINCECRYETNNGKVYERWEVPFAGSKLPETLDEKEVRKLDALFGKKLKGRQKPARPVSPPAAVQELAREIKNLADMPPAEDIPF